MRSDLDNVLDGIDFDIEALATADYPALGNAINGIAKAFKQAGYVTSAAPTSSQLTPGSGGNLSGWGQSQQALINLDMTNIDGIKSYPDQAENKNAVRDGRIVSQRDESFA